MTFSPEPSLAINRRHMKGLFSYLSALGQPTGVIVNFARWSSTTSGSGHSVINIPAYLLERLGENKITFNAEE